MKNVQKPYKSFLAYAFESNVERTRTEVARAVSGRSAQCASTSAAAKTRLGLDKY